MSTQLSITTTEPFHSNKKDGRAVRRISFDLSIYEGDDVIDFLVDALKRGAFTIVRIDTIEQRTQL